ncbi:autotransporter outer membrane beta-barrel domain-containing protein [Bosea sp. NPDC003192]|uniref:autotransporter outer membrane beta-barrel domain-containing protein n=1 Tax=Bosea sp. NPDC003192 TaxID=3390551 RepID=UPI003CFD2481
MAGKLSGTASLMILMLSCGLGSRALAATYFASTDQQLRDAIAAASLSSDVSATIVLTQDITVTGGALANTPGKSVTIDTQGFTLTGLPAASTTFNGSFSSGTLTIDGTLVGGNAAGAGSGLVINSGITTVGSTTGQVVNNGSITGGAGASGGLGVSLINVVTFVNNGTISGGTGTGAGGTNNAAGVNILNTGATLINNAGAVIQGGNSTAGGHTGAGVYLSTTSKAATITNYGTIRGGSDLSGASTGNAAIVARGASATPATIYNLGTGVIEGGNGAAAITNSAFPSAISIMNSGTIRAGAGAANAISMSNQALAVTLTLELQAGSVIEGNVRASINGLNDTLRLGGADNWTLDGSIGNTTQDQYQGFDKLEKTGASTWTIAGSGDFSGTTSVNEGALIVNGSLAGSAVTVASGARLGGSGTVGTTTLAAGSRITPGNSIGTLTINGAYVQNAGAVYEVEIDPGTVTSDRIDVKGTATLASGAAIQVINYTGRAFVAGQRYTILTSTGLTGTYGSTDLMLTPFLSLRNGTDATNAYLTVVRTATAGNVGGTGNEQAVGNAVDSLPSGNAVQTGVYNQPTVDAARGALGQLAGEIHASARTVLVDESWHLRAAVNDRLRTAFGAVGAAPMATLNYGFTADLAPAVKGPMPKPPSAERFAVWGQGYGSWGRTRSDGNAASLSRSTGGLLVGADAAVFDNLRLGVVAGFSHSKFDVNGRLSSGGSDNYHLGLYGGGQWGALSLRTGLSYTWHDLSTRRGIVAAGLGDTLRADYDAGTAQAFGELGYRIDLGQTALGQVALEPFAGLAYVVLRSDRFSERGTGAAALSGASDDTSLGYTTLGLRAATTTRLSGMDLTLHGGLGWRHAFGDVDPKTTLAFAGSNPFAIAGLPIARDAALVEAGLDLGLGPNVSLGASYTAQLAQDAQDHAFKANLAVRF